MTSCLLLAVQPLLDFFTNTRKELVQTMSKLQNSTSSQAPAMCNVSAISTAMQDLNSLPDQVDCLQESPYQQAQATPHMVQLFSSPLETHQQSDVTMETENSDQVDQISTQDDTLMDTSRPKRTCSQSVSYDEPSLLKYVIYSSVYA